MIQKKICLLGSHSVGKTCLIRQYVDSIYDDNYLKSIGVNVSKKVLRVNGEDLMLMIWNLTGDDDYAALRDSHLRGVAACIIVVDGTRGSHCPRGGRTLRLYPEPGQGCSCGGCDQSLGY